MSARETGHAYAEAERILEATIPDANLRLRVPGFVAAAMAVKRTEMLATMPANLAAYLAREFDLAIIPVPLDLPPVEIVLSWHERFHRDPANRWLRRVLFEILGKREGRALQEA